MATIKTFSPGYVDRLSYGTDLLDKTLDTLVTIQNKVPLQGSRLFRTVSAVGGSFRTSQFDNTLPLPVEDSDANPIPFVSPVKGYPKSFTTVVFRSGVQLERKLQTDDLQGKAKESMSGLLESGRTLSEYKMADVLNNLTSTDAAYVGADGVAIASASHPNRYYRTTADVWSNIETAGRLTHARYSTARTNLRKRKNAFGDPMPIAPKILWVVPEDEQEAKQIMQSEKVADNALNNRNIWQNECEVFVYDWSTSTTAWMIVGNRPAEESGFLYIVDQPANISPVTDKGTDLIWAERLRIDFTVGATIDANIQYNAGA